MIPIFVFGLCQLPTDHEQAPGAQILKKCFHARKSESFHPHSSGTHCGVVLVGDGVLELGIDISIGDYPIWRLDDEEDASGD